MTPVTREPLAQSEFRVYVYPQRRLFWRGFRWSLFYGPMRDLQEPLGKGWGRSFDAAVWAARRRMVGLIAASYHGDPTFAGRGDELVRLADERDDVAGRQW